MKKAIKWLKGTCNYDLFKSYMQDIEVAIKMATQEAKQEVFNDIEKLWDKKEWNIITKEDKRNYLKLKNKHLKTNRKSGGK